VSDGQTYLAATSTTLPLAIMQNYITGQGQDDELLLLSRGRRERTFVSGTAGVGMAESCRIASVKLAKSPISV
jgi:hypothetical protein